MLATVLLITHVKKTKKSKVPNMRKMPSNHNKSNFKNHRNCSLSTAQTSDISIAIHSNSIAGSVNLLWTWLRTIDFEWIAIEMSEVCVVEREQFLWFYKKGLVIWRHLSHFWQFQFLCFLTWVMRRTVANINPKIIHFDAVDFSGHHSKKL